ncbi:hypothetical protein EJ05DRAFT_438197 [Pseudovirgaria hyperparasitica]|uniref:Small ribosomal subunit protein mS35 mitochondrial conserved domain-containing protein n=1 Tax=Pseudovirgaria hyperparasitica TaxID=470096 RepID=A0A6A6W5Z3_9PEZI|nr:uncharacterized protein EJ05DRAFT_438197 [Pseudovirgaria hyperparasitica]KAF2758348.1 hypothetical protein EJ05DRAFT_438197 [Pseudovirgaria hyperparasitica]
MGLVDNVSTILQDSEEPFDDTFPPEEAYRDDDLGYWAEGQDESERLPDDEFYGDDIATPGHTELETHREMREFARLITWDLPLLGSLTKSFTPPTLNQPLRFRYTTYLGEDHPAANKVTVEFNPNDLPDLTYEQRATLIKLCGPRYNPEKEVVKISCEMFDTQLQNKRWLLDTTNALVKEAREGQDSFADIPFDFRHHKPKPVYKFPNKWILTEERKAELTAKRKQSDEAEQARREGNKLIDGAALVRKHHAATPALPLSDRNGNPLTIEEPVADLVMAELSPLNNYRGRRRFKRNT